jgi:hypothetical protein
LSQIPIPLFAIPEELNRILPFYGVCICRKISITADFHMSAVLNAFCAFVKLGQAWKTFFICAATWWDKFLGRKPLQFVPKRWNRANIA